MILGSTIDKTVNVLEIDHFAIQEVYSSRLGVLSFVGYAIWDCVCRARMDDGDGSFFKTKDDALNFLYKNRMQNECTEEEFEL